MFVDVKQCVLSHVSLETVSLVYVLTWGPMNHASFTTTAVALAGLQEIRLNRSNVGCACSVIPSQAVLWCVCLPCAIMQLQRQLCAHDYCSCLAAIALGLVIARQREGG